MTIRVLVNGAHGKMGQVTVKAISADPDFVLAGETDKDDSLAAEIKNKKADVVIDFTNADVAFKNTQIIIEAGAHPVIGTTGLRSEQIKTLQDLCKKNQLGGIIAPNFSLGAILMMKYAKEIANYFPNVEIIEMHHDGKLDSPSGTSIRTAELLAPVCKNAAKPSRETIPGARGANFENIHIHAIRLPGLIAHQQIIFGGLGETLTIRHDSLDRQCFMPGVRLAAKKVMELKELVYGLEHLI